MAEPLVLSNMDLDIFVSAISVTTPNDELRAAVARSSSFFPWYENLRADVLSCTGVSVPFDADEDAWSDEVEAPPAAPHPAIGRIVVTPTHLAGARVEEVTTDPVVTDPNGEHPLTWYTLNYRHLTRGDRINVWSDEVTLEPQRE